MGLQSGRSAPGSSYRDIAAVAAWNTPYRARCPHPGEQVRAIGEVTGSELHWEELAVRGGAPAASRRLGDSGFVGSPGRLGQAGDAARAGHPDR